MYIQNLKNGQVFKNYKELCQVLGLVPTKKANNQRAAQFKELARHCKYHKEGHKIVIDEVYSKELEKVDKRTLGNNNQQAKALRYLILNLLSNYNIKNDEVIGFSKALLLKKLFMINDNYSVAKTDRLGYAKALEVEKMAINECFDYLENSSIQAIKRAINVLRTQSVLNYKYSYSWVDINGYHHHCSIIEENIIQPIESDVMEEMNVRNKQKIWEFERWEEFKRKVTNKLRKRKMFRDIQYYYYSFHFNYDVENLQRHMRYMEQKQGMTYEIAKESVQELWSKSLETTIQNRHSKMDKKLAFGEGLFDIDTYKKSDKYIPEQTKIKDSIVKLDHPKISLDKVEQLNFDSIEVPF